MNKGLKIFSVICGILILAGIALVCIALALGGGLNGEKTNEVTLNAEGEFNSISVKASITDIIIKKSANGTSYAVCDESEKIKYDLKVENQVLILSEIDNRKWYDYIGIYFGGREAVLYLAEDFYDSISVNISSGDISCEEETLTFGNARLHVSSGKINISSNASQALDLSATSGNIYISKLSCESLTADASSGKITVSDVSARKSITMKATSGNINIERTTAESISIKASSGNIKLTDTAVKASTKIDVTSGNIRLTDFTSEESTAITASSGNITFAGFDSRTIEIEATSGNVSGTLLTGKTYDIRTTSGSARYPEEIYAEGGTCRVRVTSGNVNITVVE